MTKQISINEARRTLDNIPAFARNVNTVQDAAKRLRDALIEAQRANLQTPIAQRKSEDEPMGGRLAETAEWLAQWIAHARRA